jgi:predicted TIM-barrel enzyme
MTDRTVDILVAVALGVVVGGFVAAAVAYSTGSTEAREEAVACFQQLRGADTVGVLVRSPECGHYVWALVRRR